MSYKSLYFRIILFSQVIFFQAYSQNTCPPQTKEKLQLMDKYIQDCLAESTKFDALAAKISSENISELTSIIGRIKAKISKPLSDQVVKEVTDNQDWMRLREIVCPYLVQDVPVEIQPSIVFKNTSYKDGDQIIVDYDNENFIYDFVINNYPPNVYVGWEVFSGNTDYSVTSIQGFPTGASGPNCKFDLSKEYNYKIVARYGAKTMSVNVQRQKKPVQIKNIWAMDQISPSRKAKQDETLYLVKKNNVSLRQIDYNIECDAASKDFWINEPVWSTTAYNENINNDSNSDAARKISRGDDKTKASHFLDTWPSRSTTTLIAFGKEESVNISLVNEDRTKTKASLPPPIDNAINQVLTSFNKLTKDLNSMTGGMIREASLQNDFTLEQYNSQAEASRHLYKNRVLSIGLTGTISAGELPIPALTLKIPNVATIGAYVKPGISLRVDGGATERQRSELQTWEYYSFNLSGKVIGSVEAGLISQLLPTVDAVKFNIKGFAKANVYGAVSYKKIQGDKPNQIRFTAGVDPLVIGVNATVEMKTRLIDMKLLDYTNEWYICGRVEFNSDPIEF